MDFFFHNTNQDIWRHNLKYALYDEGSEPGFFLEHKIIHADNSTVEHVLQSMTLFAGERHNPKTKGLAFNIDFKRNLAKQPGGETTVLEYNSDYVWITDPKTIREKESGFVIKNRILQTEDSPFYKDPLQEADQKARRLLRDLQLSDGHL